jgi:hypothetical protein
MEINRIPAWKKGAYSVFSNDMLLAEIDAHVSNSVIIFEDV